MAMNKRIHLSEFADAPQAHGPRRPLTSRERDELDVFRGFVIAMAMCVPLLFIAYLVLR